MKIRALTEDKAFKTAVTILLAGLTVLGSSIVILNNRASGRGAEASRDSRILGIRYLTHLGRSLWETAAERDLTTSWQELGGLMMQAEAYEKMSRGVDASLYRISRERLGKVREILSGQGTVTKPPYFDAAAGAFDFFQYYLDKVAVPASELLERQEVRKAEGAFWSGVGDAYTTALAVLAVAVFLLTLSLVLTGRVRLVLSGAGLALVLAVTVAAAATAMRTWRGPSEVSVAALARTSASVVRAQTALDFGGDVAAAGAWTSKAKAELDAILARDPGYAAAGRLLSRARMIAGEALFFGGRAEAGRAEVAAGLDRIAAALRSNPGDGYLWWSKGFGEMIGGRPDDAIRSLDRALALLPDQGFALGAVRASALLLAGRGLEATAALEAAIAHALRKPLASDAVAFRTLIKNLERWNEIAPVEGLAAMVRRLKEAAVCTAVLGQAAPKASAASLVFVDPVTDKRGEIVDTPPRSAYSRFTARAHFLLELKGMAKGMSIVTKVFWKRPGQAFWIEQLRLGKAQHWEGPASARLLGFVANAFPEAGEVLASGDYRLEIYLDGALNRDPVGFQVL